MNLFEDTDESKARSAKDIFAAMASIQAAALQLLSDADYLPEVGGNASSSILIDRATEELSIFTVLFEAFWKITLGIEIDWRSFWRTIKEPITDPERIMLCGALDEASSIRQAFRKSHSTHEHTATQYPFVGNGSTPHDNLSRTLSLAERPLQRLSSLLPPEFDTARAAIRRLLFRQVYYCEREREAFAAYKSGTITASSPYRRCLYVRFNLLGDEDRSEVLRLADRHAVMCHALISPDLSRWGKKVPMEGGSISDALSAALKFLD